MTFCEQSEKLQVRLIISGRPLLQLPRLRGESGFSIILFSVTETFKQGFPLSFKKGKYPTQILIVLMGSMRFTLHVNPQP